MYARKRGGVGVHPRAPAPHPPTPPPPTSPPPPLPPPPPRIDVPPREGVDLASAADHRVHRALRPLDVGVGVGEPAAPLRLGDVGETIERFAHDRLARALAGG